MRKSIIHPRLLLFHMNYYTYIHMYNQSISHFIIIFSVYLFRNIWFYSKNKGNSLACHRYGRPRHGYGAGDGNGAGRKRHEFSLHLRRRYHDRSRREPFLLLLVKFHKKKRIALLSAVRFLNFPAWRNIPVRPFLTRTGSQMDAVFIEADIFRIVFA